MYVQIQPIQVERKNKFDYKYYNMYFAVKFVFLFWIM